MLGTGDLLLGNVAIAAVLIKTIISFFRHYFPIKEGLIPISALVLGIFSAFIISATLFDVDTTNAFSRYAQHFLAGIFIGASAMGIHETTKVAQHK